MVCRVFIVGGRAAAPPVLWSQRVASRTARATPRKPSGVVSRPIHDVGAHASLSPPFIDADPDRKTYILETTSAPSAEADIKVRWPSGIVEKILKLFGAKRR